MRTIRGTFKNRRTASNAVRRLAEVSVPADAIEVLVVDGDGNLERKVEVEDEAGTLRGAVIGGICGALLGVIVVSVVASGALGPSTAEPLGLTELGGALRAILVLGVAGVPLGAIFGLGYWNGRTRISAREVRGGSLVVVVETDELFDTARDVLREAEAVEIEERDGSRSLVT